MRLDGTTIDVIAADLLARLTVKQLNSSLSSPRHGVDFFPRNVLLLILSTSLLLLLLPVPMPFLLFKSAD